MATTDLANTEPADDVPKPSSSSSSFSKKRKTDLTEIEIDVSQPEPPSKKARRALKKGKPLPAKPASDDDNDDEEANGQDAHKPEGVRGDDDQTKATKPTAKQRSPHGIWVGNLPFAVTRSELRQWLVDNAGGAITPEDITRVHMPTRKAGDGAGRNTSRGEEDGGEEGENEGSGEDGAGGSHQNNTIKKKKSNENRGFAYVDFASSAAKIAATALSETPLGGRRLLIKDSASFEGRPAVTVDASNSDGGAAAAAAGSGGKGSAATDAGSLPKNTKIFVGNLSFDTGEDDVRGLFERCGPVRWVKVAAFEDSGKCKGYAWVNFQTAEAAAHAVRGFVKVRETLDTLEDFAAEAGAEEQGSEGGVAVETKAKDDDGDSSSDHDKDDEEEEEDDDDDDNDDGGKKPKPRSTKALAPNKPTKLRKWWVNRLLGRQLKVELAEDDQTRYRKRFGKDARNRDSAAQKDQRPAGTNKHQARHDNNTNNNKRSSDNARGAPRRGGSAATQPQPRVVRDGRDLVAARLQGTAVAAEGKKTKFE